MECRKARARAKGWPMDGTVLVYTTWPGADTAGEAAHAAVEAGLAACANVLAPMVSVYRWKGEVEQAVETPVLFKTAGDKAEALRALIAARHPYETPCIVALDIEKAGSNPAFLQWVVEETR
jgi:periplasmic divalent cation tolerance protein